MVTLLPSPEILPTILDANRFGVMNELKSQFESFIAFNAA